MINEHPIPVDQVHVSAAGELHAAEKTGKGAVFEINEQNAQLRVLSPREFHGAGEGDHPLVIVLCIHEKVLDRRYPEMEVFRALHCPGKPGRPPDIHPGAQLGRRRGGHHLSVTGEEDHILHIVAVGIIEQPHLLAY